MGLTFAPGLPPLILGLRMPSTRNLGGVLHSSIGFSSLVFTWLVGSWVRQCEWGFNTGKRGQVKWASNLVATSWCRGSISFFLLLHELSVLEIVWGKWICFHFCHFILYV
jgi:hypothetical protein